MKAFKVIDLIYSSLLSKSQSTVFIFTALIILSTAASGQSISENKKAHEINRKYITYGFEAEFKGLNYHHLVSTLSSTNDGTDSPEMEFFARTEKYPFLDFQADIESSGNIEVRSLGGERNLFQVLEQMELIKKDLKGDLKGFHMHIRIPKDMILKHNETELKSWMHYLGDIIYSWRIENRNPYLSLNSTSLSRKGVINITERGPVRLIPLKNGDWDFEIRGYMGEISKIQEMAQIFVNGVLNPTLVRKDAYAQIARSISQSSVLSLLEAYIKENNLSSLTDVQKMSLRRSEGRVTYRGLLPLYDFKSIVGFSEKERNLFTQAQQEFLSDLYNLSLKNIPDQIDHRNEFNSLIKKWSQKIGLHKLLLKNVYSDPSLIEQIQLREIEIIKEFQSQTKNPMNPSFGLAASVVMLEKNPYGYHLAKEIIQTNLLDYTLINALIYLGRFNTTETYNILKSKLDIFREKNENSNEAKRAQRYTLEALLKIDFPGKLQLMTELYEEKFMYEIILESLNSQTAELTDTFINQVLKKDTDVARIRAALEKLTEIKSESALIFFQKASQIKGNLYLHLDAIKRLSNFKDQKSIQIILDSAEHPSYQIAATEALYKMVGSIKAKLLLARIPDHAALRRTQDQAAKRDLLDKKGTLIIKPLSNGRISCDKLF